MLVVMRRTRSSRSRPLRQGLFVTVGVVALVTAGRPVTAVAEPEAAASVVQVITQANGTFLLPESVHVGPSGDVLVVDTGRNRVVRLDSTGVFEDTIGLGSVGSGNGQFNHPYQAAEDAAGNVYVADGFNNRVQKFDSAGDYVAQVSIGANKIPAGIAVSGGEVFVSNTTDNRIQVYADDLSAQTRTIGTFGTANGQLQGPRNLDIAGARLYVADQFNDRISVFNATTGAFVRKIGREGTTAGRFNSPLGVAADADGNVFVADTFNGRIQRFTAAGRYVEQYELFSSGVDLDAAGRLYAIGTTTNKVNVYQPGDGILVDARVRAGSGALVGDNVYGTDGTGQISARTSPRGSTITWTLTFQNDSTTPDRIRVKSPVLAATHYSVRYTRGGPTGPNVTAQVQGDGLVSPTLAPQAVFTVTAQVTIKASAPAGSFQARKITAKSETRPGVRDVVVISAVRQT